MEEPTIHLRPHGRARHCPCVASSSLTLPRTKPIVHPRLTPAAVCRAPIVVQLVPTWRGAICEGPTRMDEGAREANCFAPVVDPGFEELVF